MKVLGKGCYYVLTNTEVIVAVGTPSLTHCYPSPQRGSENPSGELWLRPGEEHADGHNPEQEERGQLRTKVGHIPVPAIKLD